MVMDQTTVNSSKTSGAISILLVDDDAVLRDLIRDFLTAQGFRIFESESGAEMREILAKEHIDILIIDVMMPREDGLSLVRELSGKGDFGIIMVSALGSETDRIVGLEVGADDYLAKPVSPRELLARVRALCRRRAREDRNDSGSPQGYSFAGWRLDPIRRILRDPQGVVTPLSDGEFSLLLIFLERAQRVLSREQLLELSRGSGAEAFDRAIDTKISRIRSKLGLRSRHEIIHTIRNEGYIFLPTVTRTGF